MMTDFPLVYKKLLPFGSPPMILETPLSTCGRLANTVSTREKGIDTGLASAEERGRHWAPNVTCWLTQPWSGKRLQPALSPPSRSRNPPRPGDARVAGKVPRPDGGFRNDRRYIFPDRRWNRITTPPPRLSSPIQLPGPLPREARHLILSKGNAGSLGSTVTGPAGTPLFLLCLLHWSWKAEPRSRSPRPI